MKKDLIKIILKKIVKFALTQLIKRYDKNGDKIFDESEVKLMIKDLKVLIAKFKK